MKKIGIISDTHGKLTQTQWAVEIFRQQEVSLIIHCGDIGDSAVVHAFRGIETHFVFGNTDGNNLMLRNAAEEDGNHFHGWFGSLICENVRIFFLHGHQTERFEQEIDSGDWDFVCFGHTHQAAYQMYGNTRVLNPGALHRTAMPSVAVVALPDMTVESFNV